MLMRWNATWRDRSVNDGDGRMEEKEVDLWMIGENG